MNAIYFSLKNQIKNYLKNNIVIIVISLIPIVILFTLFANVRFPANARRHLNINLGFDEFNAFFILISSIYFIINLFSFENLPITKAEASRYFIAPIKQQKVLLYFILKSYAGVLISILGIIYADLYIISFLFGLRSDKFIFLVILQILFFIFVLSFNYLMLAIKNSHTVIFNIIKLVILFISASIIAGIFYTVGFNYAITEQLEFSVNFRDTVALLNNNFYKNLPIINLFYRANGLLFSDSGLTYIIITITLIVLFTIAAYQFKFNYTDKAFELAEKNEAKRGRSKNLNKDSGSIDLLSVKAVSQSKEIKGTKSKAIISKNLIEYKRLNPLIFNLDNLLFLLIILAFVGLANLIGETTTEEVSEKISVIFSMVAVYLSFYFVSLVPKRTTLDFSIPSYFLLPVKTIDKILSGFLIANITNILNGVTAFAVLIYTQNNILISIVLAIIAFISTACCLAIDIFLNSFMREVVFTPYRLILSVVLKLCYFTFSIMLTLRYVIVTSLYIIPVVILIFVSIIVILVCLTLTKIVLDKE